MHYRHIGLIELNDHYIKGVEYIDYFDKSLPNKSKVFKFIVYLKDFLAKLKLINYLININILFKKKPNNFILNNMKLQKWNYKILPLNPYL